MLALLCAAVPACLHQAVYTARPVEAGRIQVPPEEVARLTGPADVLYVHADGAPAGIVLRRRGGGFVALLAKCTHRGCDVSALPQSYDCPCHGSRFDLDGEVLDGPAERPLTRLRVLADGAGVAILLS